MRVIIAGSRSVTDPHEVNRAIIDSGFVITEVVSGGCYGPDTFGEQWAARQGIPVKRFPADWNKHGKAAGPLRNQEMVDYADAVIAVWDGQSRGVASLMKCALNKPLSHRFFRGVSCAPDKA